jgi:hypothetical protein
MKSEGQVSKRCCLAPQLCNKLHRQPRNYLETLGTGQRLLFFLFRG